MYVRVKCISATNTCSIDYCVSRKAAHRMGDLVYGNKGRMIRCMTVYFGSFLHVSPCLSMDSMCILDPQAPYHHAANLVSSLCRRNANAWNYSPCSGVVPLSFFSPLVVYYLMLPRCRLVWHSTV